MESRLFSHASLVEQRSMRIARMRSAHSDIDCRDSSISDRDEDGRDSEHIIGQSISVSPSRNLARVFTSRHDFPVLPRSSSFSAHSTFNSHPSSPSSPLTPSSSPLPLALLSSSSASSTSPHSLSLAASYCLPSSTTHSDSLPTAASHSSVFSSCDPPNTLKTSCCSYLSDPFPSSESSSPKSFSPSPPCPSPSHLSSPVPLLSASPTLPIFSIPRSVACNTPAPPDIICPAEDTASSVPCYSFSTPIESSPVEPTFTSFNDSLPRYSEEEESLAQKKLTYRRDEGSTSGCDEVLGDVGTLVCERVGGASPNLRGENDDDIDPSKIVGLNRSGTEGFKTSVGLEQWKNRKEHTQKCRLIIALGSNQVGQLGSKPRRHSLSAMVDLSGVEKEGDQKPPKTLGRPAHKDGAAWPVIDKHDFSSVARHFLLQSTNDVNVNTSLSPLGVDPTPLKGLDQDLMAKSNVVGRGQKKASFAGGEATDAVGPACHPASWGLESLLREFSGYGSGVFPEKIFCGAYHSAFTTKNGSVYTWGLNEDGQLGRQTCRKRLKKKFAFLSTSSGPAMTNASLRNDSALFEWRPGPVKDFGGRCKVKSVALGGKHSMLLCVDGTVWVFGANDECQLGILDKGTREPLASTSTPTRIPAKEAEEWPEYRNISTPIILIAAGEKHSALVDAKERLWMWGSNMYGQVGLGRIKRLVNVQYPHQVPNLENACVLQVALGRWHSLCLTEERRVFVWGRGRHGAGVGNESTGRQRKYFFLGRSEVPGPFMYTSPQPLRALDNLHVTHICSGPEHVAAVGPYRGGNRRPTGPHLDIAKSSEDSWWDQDFEAFEGDDACSLRVGDQIYLWGRGSEGQLGTLKADDTSKPMELPFILSPGGVNSFEILSLCLGGNFTMACVSVCPSTSNYEETTASSHSKAGQKTNHGITNIDLADRFSDVAGAKVMTEIGQTRGEAKTCLYVWGNSGSGQLGLPDNTTASPTPHRVQIQMLLNGLIHQEIHQHSSKSLANKDPGSSATQVSPREDSIDRCDVHPSTSIVENQRRRDQSGNYQDSTSIPPLDAGTALTTVTDGVVSVSLPERNSNVVLKNFHQNGDFALEGRTDKTCQAEDGVENLSKHGCPGEGDKRATPISSRFDDLGRSVTPMQSASSNFECSEVRQSLLTEDWENDPDCEGAFWTGLRRVSDVSDQVLRSHFRFTHNFDFSDARIVDVAAGEAHSLVVVEVEIPSQCSN